MDLPHRREQSKCYSCCPDHGRASSYRGEVEVGDEQSAHEHGCAFTKAPGKDKEKIRLATRYSRLAKELSRAKAHAPPHRQTAL